jgi:hypothetical protein
MLFRVVSIITILALLSTIVGCSRVMIGTFDEVNKLETKTILGLMLKNGRKVYFTDEGGKIDSEKGVITGCLKRSHRLDREDKHFEVKIEEVHCFLYSKSKSSIGPYIALGAIVVVVGLLIATKSLSESGMGWSE